MYFYYIDLVYDEYLATHIPYCCRVNFETRAIFQTWAKNVNVAEVPVRCVHRVYQNDSFVRDLRIGSRRWPKPKKV